MSLLVDQYGNAISSKFLKAAENGGGRMPSENVKPLDPLRKLITYRDWQTTSFLSDKLYANFSVVEGLFSGKAIHAVGNAWKPVFWGEAKEWGKEVARWLREEWYPSCDVRGLNYDFVTNLYQDSVSIDRSGDTIKVLKESDTGWPQVQTIPARQIGQWDSYNSNDETIKEGRYKGLILRNGVIMTRDERPVAYRHLGEVRGEYKDIPAENVIHTFEPKWSDQARGLPLLSACIEDFRMIAQSEQWEQQGMLIASAIGLLEYNETGEAPTAEEDPLGVNGEPCVDSTPQIKTLFGGLYRYLKTNSGKLEQFVNRKPGEEWESFQDRQIRKAAVAGNWPYSWLWKPESANGTATRTENLKARVSVQDRQSLLFVPAVREVRFAVSVAIKNEIIAPYPGRDKGGFLKWGFTLPPRISIDEGRDAAQRREDYKIGLKNASEIVEEEGSKTYEEHLYQRAHEIALRKKIAREVSEETGEEIEEREMIMLTANDMGGDQASDQQENNQADTPPKKQEDEQ